MRLLIAPLVYLLSFGIPVSPPVVRKPLTLMQIMQQAFVNARAAAVVSNIALVNSTACSGNAGSFACTIPSSAGGTGFIILENDADNPAVGSVPTGLTGSTCVQDFTQASGSHGRLTVYNCPNVSSGVTSVTLHPTSGHVGANIREYSGLATSSMLDAIVGSELALTTVTVLSAGTVAATQTDLGIGWCITGNSATASMAVAGDWANGKDFPNVADATDSFAGDIVNGLQSPFTFTGTAASHSYLCGTALYKSAVAGSLPAGNNVAAYSNYETSTDGTTLTVAIAQAGLHGGYTGGVAVGSGFTVATAAQQTMISNVTTNGITYTPGGTRGISFNLATTSSNVVYTLANSQANLTLGAYFNISDASVQYGPFGISASGTDSLLAAYNANSLDGKMGAECVSGDGSRFAISTNTNYFIEMEYRAGGTHTLRVYGGTGYGTLIGTSTCAATGTNNVTLYEFGQNHAAAAGSGHLYVDNLQVNFTTTSLVP